ncbi:MAG: PqqD family protein [Oscillospiraceae bacterium]|nr:PqqD family protein [Oscillospiraceae bacterium]
MKIKDGFMLRQFGEDYIVVAVGDDAEDFNKLITLNSVGAYIYNLLNNDMTYEEIVSAVLDKYDADRKTVENDINIFLADAKKAGLIDG